MESDLILLLLDLDGTSSSSSRSSLCLSPLSSRHHLRPLLKVDAGTSGSLLRLLLPLVARALHRVRGLPEEALLVLSEKARLVSDSRVFRKE